MATELTLKRLRSALQANGQPLRIPPQILVGITAAMIAICMTSVLLGIHNARRDETAARTRFADAQALLALPPIDTASLQQQLDAAKQTLTLEAISAAATPIDPASDAAAELLVRRSEAAGLAVKGLARVNPASAKLGDVAYDVQGVRVTVEGTAPQITALLTDLHTEQPLLIPVLASMTLNEVGLAHADIGFDVYSRVATPTAVAPVATKPKAKK